MSELLATKLHHPSRPAQWVRRPQLHQRLNRGLELNRRVTLVSAPAGFGKTTCISDWVSSLDRWPVAWLSLDPADDDPGRFFSYFIAALQTVEENLGQEIELVIRSGQLPPGEIISTALINEILALENRLMLVLDDFHVIQDRFILQVLEQLLSNFPSPLHLVLITREDPPLPLARLRANNQLMEIRARDLRFRSDDIVRFLHEVTGLSLTQVDIKALEEKTEGWIVGLQLAALAIQSPVSGRDPDDLSGFIATLSGSHRFILSYLTEQVLNQQPEATRQFLLKTSILDKLNGDLCNAVTGRPDSQIVLEQLLKANLFLIPLDDEGQWYRYHHLFADLLRDLQNTIQKEPTTELHRLASRWYAREEMASEAIQHALAAEDYGMAVELLEKYAIHMIMRGYAKTVNGWVQSLPEGWRSRSPRTNLAFAWSLMLQGAYSQAAEYLELLRVTLVDLPVEEGTPAIRAEWQVMQSLNLYMQGKIAECEQLAEDALKLVPKQDNRVRSLAYYVLASVSWFHRDYQQAVEIYRKAIQLSRAAENLIAEMMSTTSLANMALERGQLHLAFEIASQAVERIERSGMLHPISAVIYASLGDAYYQWYEIEKARPHFQHALHLSILGGSNTITILCHVLLSRLSQVEGDLEAAAIQAQKAVDRMPLHAPEYVKQEVVAQQVRIYLGLRRPAAAEVALQGIGVQPALDDFPVGHSAPASITSSTGTLYNSRLRLLLYQARVEDDPARLRSGIEFANGMIAGALESRQLLVALETLLLRAQMHAALGDQPSSSADIARALEIAEPEGFICVFVEQGATIADSLKDLAREQQSGCIPLEYVERILNAFSGSGTASGRQPEIDPAARNDLPGMIEPLTEREQEVLRLMAEGLKYREIAAKLFISLNTVRYHVKTIYGKLNVSNRIQALALARDLRIL